MQVKNIDIKMRLSGDYELILTVPKKEQKAVLKLMEDFKAKADKEWQAEISVKKKKRSLDANAYCFVLCDKIAEKLNTTKELIYQKAIREVGAFDTLLIQNKAVDNFLNMWNRKGLGDYAEPLHESKKVEGCTVVIAYHGSSKYDSKQMARLIDYIVTEAQELGVDTMTPAEINRLKELWNGK
jgi:hypothetical protein